MTHSDHRVCGTATLRQLNDVAVKMELNRALSDEFMGAVDPDGVHVLGLALYGHDRGIVGDVFHHRADVLVKMTGSDIPARVFLDVRAADWEILMTPEQAKDAQSVGGL